MKIIEKKIDSKSKDITKCEDGLYADENFIAVIDGVTSKGKYLWDGMTSGCYAKEILLEGIRNMPKSAEHYFVIEYLNKLLNRKYFEKRVTLDNTELLRACIIIYSNYHKQIWSFGDCQCMVNNKLYNNSKKVDSIISEMRSMMIKSYLISGKTEKDFFRDDLARKAILPFLKQQQYFENSNEDYGYDVLNGQKIITSNIKVIQVQKGDEIVLATDGYPVLKNTLSKSEYELNEIVKKDPLCYKIFKATKGISEGNKSFDDRAYIRFTV